MRIREPLVEKLTVRELALKLPDMCVTRLNTTKEVIAIKFGVSGYYPMPYVRDPDKWNREHGITPAQVEAMEAGSMMGWEVPGANPDNYIEE